MRLSASREGSDLLVSDMDPFDLALAPQSVGEAVKTIADHAIDSLDARRSQRLRKLVSY
jgi:hypothetical protein